METTSVRQVSPIEPYKSPVEYLPDWELSLIHILPGLTYPACVDAEIYNLPVNPPVQQILYDLLRVLTKLGEQ